MTVQSGNEKSSSSVIGSSADVSFAVAMMAVESDDDKNKNDYISNTTNNTNNEEEERSTTTTTAVGSTTSNMTVFVWAGAILINGAFLALISYGTYTNWIIGFVISLVYTLFLFSFGFWIRNSKHGRRRTPSSTTGTTSNTPNEVQERVDDGEAEEFYANNNSMLTNLLFLLAVIAIGCSGVYLPINLSSSCNPFADDDDYYTRDCILDTVTTPVPTSVATWWEQGAYQYSHTMDDGNDDPQNDDNQTTTRGQELPAGSFAYLPESDMTLYRGHGPNQNDTVSDTLWKVSGDRTGPQQISEMKFPHDFVVIDLHEPQVSYLNGNKTESIPATKVVACFFVDSETTAVSEPISKATFYGGNPNGNACGYNDLPQVTFPKGFSVAIGGEKFNDGYGCGACYEVTCNGAFGNNSNCSCGGPGQNKVIVQATDQCPECGSTHFDLNEAAFTSIVAGQSFSMAGTCGVLETQFKRVSCNFESNIKIRSKSGTSGYWYGLHIDDVGGYGAISKIQLREKSRKKNGQKDYDIVCDKSQGSSFWICNRPNNREITAPLDVKLTDSAGRKLYSNNVIMNLSGNQEFDFRKNYGPIDDDDDTPVANPNTTKKPFYHSSTLACTTDGTNTIDTIDNDRDDDSFFRSARGPIYLDDRNSDSYDNRNHPVIYFRADDSLCYNGLYSVDPTNLTDWTRHTTKPTTATMSILQEQQLDIHVDTECSNRELRMLFIWLLFLSAFPTVTVSFFIGLVLKVPSMVLAYFGSVLWMMVCFLYVIAPNFAIDSDGLYQFFRWFPVVVSAPFLIVLTFGSLTKRISNQLLAWGINFYALVYVVGIFVLLQVFSHEALWRWIVLTVLGIIPLIVISLATNKVFLMVLAALGLMIEAGRLAFYIATVTNVAAGLIVSIVLAGLGITFGFVGFLLRKYHSNIQRKVQEWTRAYLGRWIQPTSSPSHIGEHWP